MSGWSGHDFRRTTEALMRRFSIARKIRMRVTAPPRNGATSSMTLSKRHSWRSKSLQPKSNASAEGRRFQEGGVGPPRAGKNTPACVGGRMPQPNSRKFLELGTDRYVGHSAQSNVHPTHRAACWNQGTARLSAEFRRSAFPRRRL